MSCPPPDTSLTGEKRDPSSSSPSLPHPQHPAVLSPASCTRPCIIQPVKATVEENI